MDLEKSLNIELVYEVINKDINNYSKEIKENPYSTSSLIARSQLRRLKKAIALKYKKYLNKHTVLLPTKLIFNQDDTGTNR